MSYTNPFFNVFEQVIETLRASLRSGVIVFASSDEGNFAKEVINRLTEESLGYIADLRCGASFVAKHHARGLIELYASVALITGDISKKNRYLERFQRFPEIQYHKIYIKHSDSIIDLSNEIIEKHFKEYAELKNDLLQIFDKKNNSELITLKTWRGSRSIEELIKMLPQHEVHLKNYNKLCLFAHFSSLCRCSEIDEVVFDKEAEQMLAVTVKYACDCYFYLRMTPFLSQDTIQRIDEIIAPIAPHLLPLVSHLSPH